MPRTGKSVADKIKELAEKSGLTITEDMQATLDAAVPRTPEELEFSLTEDVRIRSAAAVDFLQHPHAYVIKKCTNCGENFATNYSYVGTCSTSCAIRRMQTLTGMHWEWTLKWYNKSLEERWNRHQAPAIVDPDLLKSLVHIAQMVQAADQNPQARTDQTLQAQEDTSPGLADSVVYQNLPDTQKPVEAFDLLAEEEMPSHLDEPSPAPSQPSEDSPAESEVENVFDF